MGRRKPFYKPSLQIETGNDKYDNQAGRIKAINTWDDIEHDSEDEYYKRREKILIDDSYSQRQDEIESSEEEVFALQTGDALSEDEEEKQDSDNFDDFDSQTWGNHKKNYYDADELSDFDEAKEEEEEALRLQKKKISKMSEEDFFDDNWLGTSTIVDKDKDDEKKLMERLNKEVQKISFEKGSGEIQPEILNREHYSNLSRTEIIEILQDESPELVELLSEFKKQLSIFKDTLAPILEKAKKRNIKDDPAMKFLSIKYHTLLNYLTNISFYFFLKSSGIHHLRTHPVIDALVDLRTTLNKLETLESKMEVAIKEFIDRLEMDEQIDQREDKELEVDEKINEIPVNLKVKKAKAKKSKGKNESIEPEYQKKLDKEKKNEESKKIKPQHGYTSEELDIGYVNNLSSTTATLIEPEFVSFKNVKRNKRKQRDLDFGDLDALNDVDADDKAQNRKSLRHYVAKIDQNLVKREKAIRLSGDADIPYKDKNKSAIKSVNNQNGGDDLDYLDWNEDDEKVANDVKTEGEEDKFYLAVQKTKKSKKEQKDFEHGQLIENDKIVYEEEILSDGSKRQINYQILKNKGLTPHRKKDQRNPRVKHRNKYEKAKKKIKSIKRIVVQQKGPYDGEKTGIKTKLSRSIKFGN